MKTFAVISLIGILLFLCRPWTVDLNHSSTELRNDSNTPARGFRDVVVHVCLFGGPLLVVSGLSNLLRFRDPSKRECGLQGRRYRWSIWTLWVCCGVLTFPIWVSCSLHLLGLSPYQVGPSNDELYRNLSWYIWPCMVALSLGLTILVAIFGMRKNHKLEQMQAAKMPVCRFCGYDRRGDSNPHCPECGNKQFYTND